MNIPDSISRLTTYYTRHGFRATVRRAGLAMRRSLTAGRVVVFYCDLTKQTLTSAAIPDSLKVDRVASEEELSQQDLKEMTNFWNPRLAARNMEERFTKGASLWLVNTGGHLAGYGWTLQGRTIEPYYFPLRPDDVHLFDFHVFPQYRGQGINPMLVTHILHRLGPDCRGLAYIEAAEWNEAQLSSLEKTPFHRLGLVRKLTVFGHAFVMWADRETGQQVLSSTKGNGIALPVPRSHEQ